LADATGFFVPFSLGFSRRFGIRRKGFVIQRYRSLFQRKSATNNQPPISASCPRFRSFSKNAAPTSPIARSIGFSRLNLALPFNFLKSNG